MGESLKAPADSSHYAFTKAMGTSLPPPRPRDTEGLKAYHKLRCTGIDLEGETEGRRVGRLWLWNERLGQGWQQLLLTAGKMQRNSESLERDAVWLCRGLFDFQLVRACGEHFLMQKCPGLSNISPSSLHPTTYVLFFPLFLRSLFLSCLPFFPPFSPFFFFSFFLSCTFLESSRKGQVPGSSHSIPGHSCGLLFTTSMLSFFRFSNIYCTTFQPLPNSLLGKDEKSILLIPEVLTPTR